MKQLAVLLTEICISAERIEIFGFFIIQQIFKKQIFSVYSLWFLHNYLYCKLYTNSQKFGIITIFKSFLSLVILQKTSHKGQFFLIDIYTSVFGQWDNIWLRYNYLNIWARIHKTFYLTTKRSPK